MMKDRDVACATLENIYQIFTIPNEILVSVLAEQCCLVQQAEIHALLEQVNTLCLDVAGTQSPLCAEAH